MLQRDAARTIKFAISGNSGKSADPILHRESPHLKIRSNAKGDFKN
jgi:hypothetical protein